MIRAKPPWARPNSTPAPAVITSISSIELVLIRLIQRPVSGSTLLTLPTTAWKSREREPWTLGLPSPSASWTPGAIVSTFW